MSLYSSRWLRHPLAELIGDDDDDKTFGLPIAAGTSSVATAVSVSATAACALKIDARGASGGL